MKVNGVPIEYVDELELEDVDCITEVCRRLQQWLDVFNILSVSYNTTYEDINDYGEMSREVTTIAVVLYTTHPDYQT